MLEKIMDLQILLYSMAALGTLGAIGMLTTNLTYRRMLKMFQNLRKHGDQNPHSSYFKNNTDFQGGLLSYRYLPYITVFQAIFPDII